ASMSCSVATCGATPSGQVRYLTNNRYQYIPLTHFIPSPTHGRTRPARSAIRLQGLPTQAAAGVLPGGAAGFGLARGRGAVPEPAGREPAAAGAGARTRRALAGAQRPP